MNILRSLAFVIATAAFVSTADAAIITLDLLGKAGVGLIPGNENHVVSGTASGGEVGTGILFDDVSLALTINVAWGTANGFSNLTGNATAGHIHGPTASGGVGSFTQNAGVLIGLDGGIG